MVATKWRKFVSDTTVHGLRYVFESPSRLRRLIWLLLLLGAIAIDIYFLIESVEKYSSKPFNTEFTEVVPENGEISFPAVKICNLNRFVKRKINMFENDENFHKMGLNLSACEVTSKVNKSLSCGQALMCAFEPFGWAIAENCNMTIRQRIISALNRTKEPIFNPEEFIETFGHDFAEMFLYYCRFSVSQDCTSADFHPTLTKNGHCFTFNSGKNGTKVRSTRRAGVSGGLSVILDVQAYENTVSEFSRGLRVVVHDPGAIVNLDKGFNVFPGSHALARIAAIKHERLPYPYKSDCTRRVLPKITRYSRDGCFIQCTANVTLKRCGCREIGAPVPSNSPVCSFQHHFCEKQKAESYNPFNCSCDIPCEETEYMTQVSYSQFPDDGASKILKYKHAYNKSVEYQRGNLVFLQVGYQRHGYTLMRESPSYKIGSLMGDIGGNMGLFLGCSLLTIFEFFDLAWNILEYRANKNRNIAQEQMGNEGV